MDKSSHYYLSAETCTQKMLCFRAVFCESCQIKKCYIIAPNLYHAMLILYDKLSPIYNREYLDSNLLKIEFNDVIFG